MQLNINPFIANVSENSIDHYSLVFPSKKTMKTEHFYAPSFQDDETYGLEGT
jgi:hypothetical protein